MATRSKSGSRAKAKKPARGLRAKPRKPAKSKAAPKSQTVRKAGKRAKPKQAPAKPRLAPAASVPVLKPMPAAPARRRLRPRAAVPAQPRPAPQVRAKLLAANPYDIDLDRNPANFQPLTPLSFLERAARTWPEATAIIHGARRYSYAEFYARSRRLASALAREGIGRGDTVSVLFANTPAMLEAHHGVPMTGGVLNALNTRLDAAAIAFMLDHSGAKLFIADREFAGVAKAGYVEPDALFGALAGRLAEHYAAN